MFKRADQKKEIVEQEKEEIEPLDATKEEIEEIINEEIERCNTAIESNIYYNILKAKQEKNIDCIESSGATDKHGKPCGFRRS